jgi:hypothetical protein
MKPTAVLDLFVPGGQLTTDHLYRSHHSRLTRTEEDQQPTHAAVAPPNEFQAVFSDAHSERRNSPILTFGYVGSAAI